MRSFIIVLVLFLCALWTTEAQDYKQPGPQMTRKSVDELQIDNDPPRQMYKPTGSEGIFTGTVRLEGTPPASTRIDLSGDPTCVEIGSPIVEDVLVTDGMLANVFVYIKSGGAVDSYSFETPSSEVVLYHLGCQFVPRVVGLQVQQTLKIENSDSTSHNTHPYPVKNAEWNKSQSPGGAAIESKFGRPETMIPIKCHQHPWQRAYVGVLTHPFFAVSGRDGSFTIKGIPPGE